MKRTVALVFVILAASLAVAVSTKDLANNYISKYSDMAVAEMQRSGVPASITLAQGLLESGYGRSRLATEANNHFGIKCHRDWTGESITADDDAKGECFRKYGSVADSYRDHSDFLRYKDRYAFLFDLDPSDYEGWAHGLKKAGYATDPSYALKLITTIKTYDLTRFDSAPTPEETPSELSQPVRFKGEGRKGTYAVYLSREVLKVNGKPLVYAREGETYRSIAAAYDLFPKELAGFNDSADCDRPLVAGEYVFLAAKANKAAKGLDKHVCEEGEMLWNVSQKYGIKLKALMKMNGIEDAQTPMSEDMTLLLRPVKKLK